MVTSHRLANKVYPWMKIHDNVMGGFSWVNCHRVHATAMKADLLRGGSSYSSQGDEKSLVSGISARSRTGEKVFSRAKSHNTNGGEISMNPKRKNGESWYQRGHLHVNLMYCHR